MEGYEPKGYLFPGEDVVTVTYNCEIILTRNGFYSRCTTPNCTWVSETTPSKSVARRWANNHNEDQEQER